MKVLLLLFANSCRQGWETVMKQQTFRYVKNAQQFPYCLHQVDSKAVSLFLCALSSFLLWAKFHWWWHQSEVCFTHCSPGMVTKLQLKVLTFTPSVRAHEVSTSDLFFMRLSRKLMSHSHLAVRLWKKWCPPWAGFNIWIERDILWFGANTWLEHGT